MSGWKIVTRQLYNAGRELRRDQFDHNEIGSDPYTAIREAKNLGLMRSVQKHYTWFWYLTDLGRDYCEGRCTIDYPKAMSRGGKRTKCATWLRALPRANEIRLERAC